MKRNSTPASRAPVPAPAQRARGITRAMGETFLERLAQGFSVTAAAESTGRSRRRFYALREADEEFAKAWDDAWEAGQDWIEDELRAAATTGWLETDETIENGQVVRRVERHRRDPRLLARLERKRQPEVAAARGPAVIVVHSAFPGIGPPDVIEVEAVELPALPEEAS